MTTCSHARVASAALTPNPSVEARPNGIGPRGAEVHHAPRGPMPWVPPHLARWASASDAGIDVKDKYFGVSGSIEEKVEE